ncbi:MAG: hypothetical protein DRJ42_19475 [Deltaproteobacteria bacterium]|nr:MAG: hypothetical protein DRJ42_19475 [Deltaproteobacteria bacterium]
MTRASFHENGTARPSRCTVGTSVSACSPGAAPAQAINAKDAKDAKGTQDTKDTKDTKDAKSTAVSPRGTRRSWHEGHAPTSPMPVPSPHA